MYNSHSSPELVNCTFSENNAVSFRGGGIYNNYESNPTLINCAFSLNISVTGGGMYNGNNSNPTLINCTFSKHFLVSSGGGIHNSASSPVLFNCTFIENEAYMAGAGMCNEGNSNPTLSDCTFSGNLADSGGGMYNDASSPELVNCMFRVNSADWYGGGMYNEGSNPIVTNCTFSGNSADWGGGMYNNSSSPTLTNCILWANANDQVFGTLTITYSCVQGGWSGTGNIDADPLFVRDPDDGGDGWGDDPDTPGVDEGANDDYGNLRLRAGSPCIDAGDNTAVPADTLDLDDDGNTTERIPFDLDGFARFFDMDPPGGSGVDDLPDYPEIVDMGAYESSPKAPADFDYDGDVDTDDFDTFKACVTGPTIPYDPEVAPRLLVDSGRSGHYRRRLRRG